MTGALVRQLYTRVSRSSALRGPLARVRAHPRVRAFARRRVGILLAPGTTWANVDGALRLLAEDPTQPIVFGRWHGDPATELLYWVPFVRWAQRHFSLDAKRVAVVTQASWHDARRFESVDEATAAFPGAAVFPSEPVHALVDEYRCGDRPLRPLLKRAQHVPLAPADGRTRGLVTEYGGGAIEAALSGVPVIALRPSDGSLVEPDVDLAIRVVSSLGGTFVVLRTDELKGLRKALASTASPPERPVQ